jgi:Zn-dependent oligopeptidase
MDREDAAGLVTGELVEEFKLSDDGLNSVFSLSRVITNWFRSARSFLIISFDSKRQASHVHPNKFAISIADADGRRLGSIPQHCR